MKIVCNHKVISYLFPAIVLHNEEVSSKFDNKPCFYLPKRTKTNAEIAIRLKGGILVYSPDFLWESHLHDGQIILLNSPNRKFFEFKCNLDGKKIFYNHVKKCPIDGLLVDDLSLEKLSSRFLRDIQQSDLDLSYSTLKQFNRQKNLLLK